MKRECQLSRNEPLFPAEVIIITKTTFRISLSTDAGVRHVKHRGVLSLVAKFRCWTRSAWIMKYMTVWTLGCYLWSNTSTANKQFKHTVGSCVLFGYRASVTLLTFQTAISSSSQVRSITILGRQFRAPLGRSLGPYSIPLTQQNNRVHSYTITTIRSKLQFLLRKRYRIGA